MELGMKFAHAIGSGRVFAHHSTGLIGNRHLQHISGRESKTLVANIHERFAMVDAQRLHLQSPKVEIAVMVVANQRNRAEDTRTGIPSIAFLVVFNSHFQGVFAHVHKRRGIHTESVVAIRPVSGFLTVDFHHRVRHHAIEMEFHMLRALLYLESGFVEPLANPWQSTGASGVLGSHIFTVFLDSHHLQVPFFIEGTADCPIVGHFHIFPFRSGLRELPIRELTFAMRLCRSH